MLADLRVATNIVDLEHILCQIKADSLNFHLGLPLLSGLVGHNLQSGTFRCCWVGGVHASSLSNIKSFSQNMAKESGRNLEAALFGGLIWGYLGIIYGTVFIGLVRVFEHLEWPIHAEILAAALTGAISVLFYGSMQLTVFAAMAGTLTTFGFLALASGSVHPLGVVMATGPAGLVVGVAYALGVKTSRVFRVDAKILAGLSSGLAGAALLAILFWLIGPLPVWATTAILCSVTGTIYALVVSGFVKRFHDLLPPIGDGALVGAGVAVFVGLAIWVVVGELNSHYTGPYTVLAKDLLARVPQAAGGGALGGALAGFSGSLMGKPVEDI